MRALLLVVCVAAGTPADDRVGPETEAMRNSLGSVSKADETFVEKLSNALGTPADAPAILQMMPSSYRAPLEGLFPEIQKVKDLFEQCTPALLVAKKKIATWSTEDGQVTAADADWSPPATRTQLKALLAETDKLDVLLALGASELSQIRLNLVSLADNEAERGTTLDKERQQNQALIQDIESKLTRHLALLEKAVAATPDGTENGRTAVPVLTELELSQKNLPHGDENGVSEGFSSLLEMDENGPDFGIGRFEDKMGELVKEEKIRRDKIKAEMRAEDQPASLMELRREGA